MREHLRKGKKHILRVSKTIFIVKSQNVKTLDEIYKQVDVINNKESVWQGGNAQAEW